MSQILAMAKRLQDTERTVAGLRAALDQATTRSSQTASPYLIDASLDDTLHTATDIWTRDDTDGDSNPEPVLLSDLSLDENGKARGFFLKPHDD